MNIDVFTLFPEAFDWFERQRHVANALAQGHTLGCVNYRDHTPLSAGQASWTVTNFSAAPHATGAFYSSDLTYASCSGSLSAVSPLVAKATAQPDGSFRIVFTNVSGAPFEILGTSDLSLEASNWPVLGAATEVTPGVYRFSDSTPIDSNGSRFYRVRSP